MINILTYIALLTTIMMELYCIIEKDYRVKFVSALTSVFILSIILIFYSNVNEFILIVNIAETCILLYIVFRTIISGFNKLEEDDE